jgi:sensor histidine kinase YesM
MLINAQSPHGLASRKIGGKINIGFLRKGSFLVCTIEDNGIGRKKAQELKQQKLWKGSKSLGMKITQERIDLLSIQQKQKIDLKIEDILDEENNPLGTRVSIFFPFH